jgi:hypothetical protein
MPDKKEIKAQLKGFPGISLFAIGGLINELTKLLGPDERIHHAVQGNRGGKDLGLGVVTNRRLILLRLQIEGLLKSTLSVRDFTFDQLTSVEYQLDGRFARVSVLGSGIRAELDGLTHQYAREFCETIRQRIGPNRITPSTLETPEADAMPAPAVATQSSPPVATPRPQSNLRAVAIGAGMLLLLCVCVALFSPRQSAGPTTKATSTGISPITASQSQSASLPVALAPTAQSTNTPKPTEPSRPTNTRVPTFTPIPTLTSTPEPTHARIDGNAIEAAFRRLGWTFQNGQPSRGRLNRTGTPANKLSVIQMIGDMRNLTNTSIAIGIPNDNPKVAETNGLYLALFLETALPGWDNGVNWAIASFKAFVETGQEETVNHYEGRTLKMHNQLKTLGLVVLEIE